MSDIEILKAEDKCQTCRDQEICGCSSQQLIHPDDMDKLQRKFGIEVVVIVHKCRQYHRR